MNTGFEGFAEVSSQMVEAGIHSRSNGEKGSKQRLRCRIIELGWRVFCTLGCIFF